MCRRERRSWPLLAASLAAYLVTLFALCMVCHENSITRGPRQNILTTFYLTIAAGGVLAEDLRRASRAQHVYRVQRYPIGLAAACLLGLVGWLRSGAWALWTRSNFAIRIPLMALLLGGIAAATTVSLTGAHKAAGIWRNFYGILRITDLPDPKGAMRELTHGRIQHGSQYLEQAWRDRPTSYYGPHSGVALALNALPQGPRQIAVIGLGTGTIAAWGRPAIWSASTKSIPWSP
jgi:hypothetical protein